MTKLQEPKPQIGAVVNELVVGRDPLLEDVVLRLLAWHDLVPQRVPAQRLNAHRLKSTRMRD